MPPTQRKVNDSDIVNLNSVGISLGSIAKRLGCHHTTVTHRLKVLGIEPADTRRAFMEEIYDGLSEKQREWLIEQLGPRNAVKEFIESLIIRAWMDRNR